MGLAFSAVVDGCLRLGRAYAGVGSSNLAELLAIHFALDVLRPPRGSDVTLFTDSQYALRLIDGEWGWGSYGWLVRAIRARGVRIQGMLVDLVRGHRNVQGNEGANYGAYQAAARGREYDLGPVYVPNPGAARRLEAGLLPMVRRVPAGLAVRVMEVHQKIRRGKRQLDDIETALVDEVLGRWRDGIWQGRGRRQQSGVRGGPGYRLRSRSG